MSLDPLKPKTDVVTTALPHKKLPTMYDLPSEEVGEEGLPDVFHSHQPNLLRETFHSEVYPDEQVFIGSDINLYYDAEHTLWYKRPDWLVVVGVPYLYEGWDMRYSYVVWDEGVNPLIVVELLSEGTEKEDLGQTIANKETESPPTKWQVYEQVLKIPYYVTFDRVSNELRAFRLEDGEYVAFEPSERGLWIAEVELWLGLWVGSYERIERPWLRWRDKNGNWIPTNAERAEEQARRAEQECKQKEVALQKAEQEAQRAEQERKQKEAALQQVEQMAAKLRALGIDPDEFINKK
jgi:Uma2 family endonuclease